MPTATAANRERLPHTGDEPHLLREIIRTHQVLMAGFSRGVGMPASRFGLMRLLTVAERNVGVMDLARQLGINPAAVTRQVKEMESEGLVRRRDDPRDGRRNYVTLSPKGLRLFKDIHARTHELERALSSIISADDLEVTAKVLSTLRNFLETPRLKERAKR